jgi:hypothetical protein
MAALSELGEQECNLKPLAAPGRLAGPIAIRDRIPGQSWKLETATIILLLALALIRECVTVDAGQPSVAKPFAQVTAPPASLSTP